MFELLASGEASPSRVVVIGTRGVIGSELVEQLAAAGVACLAVSSSDIDLLSTDAADRLAEQLQPDDTVVMLSALTPDKGRDVATFQKNIAMANAVCDAIRMAPPAHVIYMSSDAVYPFASGLVSEESAAAPGDLYGLMHRTREVMFAETCGAVPLACLRCTLVLSGKDTHNSYGPNRFRRQAAEGGKITLGGGGEETRDHLAVGDVARFIVDVARCRGKGTVNLASGVSHSFYDVANMVARAMAGSVEVVTTDRTGPITHRHFDTTRLRRAFPDFVFTPLPDAIAAVHAALGLSK